MNWKRPRPGLYVAGPYTVQKIADGWEATGPDVEGVTDHREQAGALCEAAAEARDPKRCEPVIGDIVLVTTKSAKGRRHLGGTVRAVLNSNHGPTQQTIWSVQFTAGKRRVCLFRHEFEVMVP